MSSATRVQLVRPGSDTPRGLMIKELISQEISTEIWRDKYRDGDESSIADSQIRVINGVYEKDSNQRARIDALEALTNMEWLPGGRINAGAGTKKRVTLINCLSGDTKILTKTGVVALSDVVGKNVHVWTANGWEPANIHSFGRQPTQKVFFNSAHKSNNSGWMKSGKFQVSATATPNHRWILIDGTETTQLKIGDVVPAQAVISDNTSESFIAGFRHGIVFGDGSKINRPRTGFDLYQLRLCGERKQKLVSVFEEVEAYAGGKDTCVERCTIRRGYYDNGDIIITYYSNIDLKSVPSDGMDSDYYAGFIRGWCATDGSETTKNRYSVFSQNLPALDWLVDHASLGGFVVSGYRSYCSDDTNFGKRKNACYVVRLCEALDSTSWKVSEIITLGEEEVFCAVVPGAHAFTLSSGVYTGNCFVSDTIFDSMEGIMKSLTEAALTQQQGGGIGMDFSTLRPCGAIVRRTGSVSTGPLPFMDMWNSMCGTIKSSGARRGAMMGVMSDWHPDILKFIVAKREKGRLTNFNVSVLVSDALMDAVKRGLDWELGFSQPLADPSQTVEVKERDGRPWYVYERFPAKKLWDSIITNTYDWAEPGVIFIDRVNQLNNLSYCETIRCSNPCGEQMLPPNGDCNLGHVNLAGMVMKPFTNEAEWNRKRVEEVTRIGIRFLDNVLDVSGFPTEEQRQEAFNKRRTGLGYTAIANLMQQMKVKYGSRKSTDLTTDITQTMAIAAYDASCDLARERGPFPLYNKDKFMSAPFVKKLPSWLKDKLAQYGARNGVLLTIAPVGTGSVFYGNISSGIEPTIFHVSDRKVLNPDGSFRSFEKVEEYGYKLFKHYHPGVEEVEGQPVGLPSYMVTANDLSVEEHLKVQAAAQRWIDSSISKTINCPKDITYQDFEKVYLQAWDMGLKGCTTYRPSDVRGAVITPSGTEKTNGTNGHGEILIPPRPESLESKTYKVKWPQAPDAFYITISDIVEEDKKRPFEIFINSKSVKHQEWITALTRCISAIFRRGGDVTFIVEELMQVYSINEGCWVDQEYTPSLVARIGKVIKQHMADSGEGFIVLPPTITDSKIASTDSLCLGEYCNQCGNPSVYKQEGCRICRDCGFSTCD